MRLLVAFLLLSFSASAQSGGLQMNRNTVFNASAVFKGTVERPYKEVSSAYTLVANDQFINVTSGTFTVTLPTLVAGIGFYVKNSGAGTVSLAAPGTIDGAPGYDIPAGLTAQLLSIGGGNYILLNQ